MSLTTTQMRDDDAGDLASYGARGGPKALQGQVNYFGINDTLAGDYRTHANFTPEVMSLFASWQSYIPDARRSDPEGRSRQIAVARRAVARGEALFNTKPIAITGVKGLNDALGAPVIAGTCTTCHNAPEVGSHSVKRFFNTGTSDPFLGGPNNRDHNPLAGNLRDFPFYSIAPKNNRGAFVTTTDPGRALISGSFADLARFKVPNLRGLGSRAPYFHNGLARTLNEVVTFYNVKFGMQMTSEEIRKVVLFLQQT